MKFTQRRLPLEGALLQHGLGGQQSAQLAAVEMLSDIGQGVFPPIGKYIVEDIMSHNIDCYTSHKLLEIKDNAIIIENIADRKITEVQCDSVVVSLGVAPQKGIEDEYEKVFNKVIVIGDANKGGRIHNATKDAFIKAYAFE